MRRISSFLLLIVTVSGCGESQHESSPVTRNSDGDSTVIAPMDTMNVDEQRIDESDSQEQAEAADPNSPRGVFDAVIDANAKADYRTVWNLLTTTSQSAYLNAVAFQAFGHRRNIEKIKKNVNAIGGTSGQLYKSMEEMDRNFGNALKMHSISRDQLAEIMKDVTDKNYSDTNLSIARGEKLRQLVQDDIGLFTDLCVAAESPGFFGPRSIHGLEDVNIKEDVATATMSTDGFGGMSKSLLSFEQVDGQWKMHTQKPL
jgi:hypothetical protein